jgi:hypothetical protein
MGVVLLVHLGLVITITLIFFFQTRISFLGQSWQSVAHVPQSSDDEIMVAASEGSKDSEIRRMMRDRKQDDFVMLRSHGRGSVGLFPK